MKPFSPGEKRARNIAFDVPALPTQGSKVRDSEQISDAELAQIGLRPSFSRQSCTTAFSSLCGAVRAAAEKLGTIHAEMSEAQLYQNEVITSHPSHVEQVSTRREGRTAPHEQEGSIRVEARGMLEGIGMADQEFATRTRQVFDPFLRQGTYRFTFTTQSYHYTPAYFGIHGDQGHHRHRRGATHAGGWFEMASHQFVGEQGHDITLRRDGLDPTKDYTDIRNFWSNALREMIHGLGKENREVFEARVRSHHRIPYPYTEHFLDVAHGQIPDYEHMADAYRSKTYEMIFQVRTVPSGSTVEAEATRVICERFPRVSMSVVQSDVRAALSLLPEARWTEVLHAYQELVRRSSAQFEHHILRRRVIDQVPDAELAGQLSNILDQTQQTLAGRILSHTENAVESMLARELIRDVREYHQTRVNGLEAEITAQHPELVPMVQNWKEMARFIAERGRFHRDQLEADERAGVIMTVVNGREVVRPTSDDDRMAQFAFNLRAVSPTNFVQAWNRLLPDEQRQIRPMLEQMERLVSHTELLPPIFAVRAEQARIQ